MGERFSDYMNEQPAILRRLLSRPADHMEDIFALCADMPACIVMIGSGSSYHAACAAAPFMRKLLKADVECLTPSMAMALPSLKEGLVLAVSQSGTSTSTLEIVGRLKAAGRPVVCVTAMPQSPVSVEAGLHLDVLCGEEQVGPKTKGVTATLMALLTFAYNLSLSRQILPAEELARFNETLQTVPERVDDAIKSGGAFFTQNEERLRSLNHIVFVSGIKRMGACAECALKLMETCRFPSFYYELEECMHGVHYTIGEESAFLFLPDASSEERMLRLKDFADKNGAPTFWVSLPYADDIVGTFVLMAFFYGVCAGLSLSRGINCDIARYPDFGKHMETKTN